VSSRAVEAVFLAIIALVILFFGAGLLSTVAAFKGVAVSVLLVLAVLIVYAFRMNYRASRAGARLAATRDTAFLAAIIAAIAYITTHAHWALGATVVGTEVGVIVEFLTRLAPPGRTGLDAPGSDVK
jgi:hypothetical protein